MTDTTALAQRDSLSMAEIGRRIDLNAKSGWGLERGSPPQLNMLALYCQKRQLLPGDEVTLYEGRPWITVDGHVTLMTRHPDYKGFSQRPLSRQEKEDWGYDPEDLVVETTIRTSTMGDIKAYGKVSRDERNGAQVQGRRLNPVARFNPVEMAQKRSLARAHRFAFGLDSYVDDEAFEREVRTVVQERADPERIARNSETYSRIYESEYGEEGTTSAAAEPPAAVDAPPVEAPNSAGAALVTDKNDPLWQEWLKAEKKALKAGFDGDTSNIHLGISRSDLQAAIDTLLADVEAERLVP